MDISERMSALLTALHMTPYQLAKELGYRAPEKIYTIINRKSKPGFDTLTDILNRFDELSSEWLMRGDGEMFKKDSNQTAPDIHLGSSPVAAAGPKSPIGGGEPTREEPLVPATDKPAESRLEGGTADEAYWRGKSVRPLAVTVDRLGNDTILLVPIKAQAGYRQRYFDLEYIKELSSFTLPNFNTGTYRAFEVEGDSMHPTIRHSDFVICSYVENWEYIRPRHVYVIITPEYVLVKRIAGDLKDKKTWVELESDNRFYTPAYRLPVNEIREVWQVRGILTTQIPANLYEAQERLVTVIETLGRNATDTQSLVKDLISRLAIKELEE
ncbi:MAG: S24 family peptidase [Ferruginibacter sp.]|nr:S24 family peptidase [Cytophagales bacterium]